MRIVYHLGAHCTDEDRLVRCLLKNRAVLAEQGIIVPSPTRYRKLMRDTAVQLRGGTATVENQALILDQIMEETEADRLILSWDSFLSFPAWVIRGSLYAAAGERIRAFTRIFPDIETEFHLAIRNPASFIPALQAKVTAKNDTDVLKGADPTQLRWSTAINDILNCNPGVPLTVWCDEETPLIWPEVLQAVSGHADGTNLIDSDDVLALIMSDIGLNRMRSYCSSHPPETVEQRRRIVTAFLERFALPEKVDMEVDMPGWTHDIVDEMSYRYLEDVELIRHLPGVQLIEA